jgi:hypothetical protein
MEKRPRGGALILKITPCGEDFFKIAFVIRDSVLFSASAKFLRLRQGTRCLHRFDGISPIKSGKPNLV